MGSRSNVVLEIHPQEGTKTVIIAASEAETLPLPRQTLEALEVWGDVAVGGVRLQPYDR